MANMATISSQASPHAPGIPPGAKRHGAPPPTWSRTLAAPLRAALLWKVAVATFQLVHSQPAHSALVQGRPRDAREVFHRLRELAAQSFAVGTTLQVLGQGGQGLVTRQRLPNGQTCALKRMFLVEADVREGGALAGIMELAWGAAHQLQYLTRAPPHVILGCLLGVEPLDDVQEGLAAAECVPARPQRYKGPGLEARVLYPVIRASMLQLLDATATVRAGEGVGPVCRAMLAGRRIGTRAFNLSCVTSTLRQVVQGVAWLHASRILHNDLKPANVLVAQAAAVMAGDEGEEAGRALTASVADMGGATVCWAAPVAGPLIGPPAPLQTPRYSHPERLLAQAAGDNRTAAADDLHALGVMVLDALLGPDQRVTSHHGATLEAFFASSWAKQQGLAAATKAALWMRLADQPAYYNAASLRAGVRRAVADALHTAPYAASDNWHADDVLQAFARVLELGVTALWAPTVSPDFNAAVLARQLSEVDVDLRNLPYEACWVGVEPDGRGLLQLPPWELQAARDRAEEDPAWRAALLALYQDAEAFLGGAPAAVWAAPEPEEEEEGALAAVDGGEEREEAAAAEGAAEQEGQEEAAMTPGPPSEVASAAAESAAEASVRPDAGSEGGGPQATAVPAPVEEAAEGPGPADEAAAVGSMGPAGEFGEWGPQGMAGGGHMAMAAAVAPTWAAWGRRHALAAAAIACPLLATGALLWMRRRRGG